MDREELLAVHPDYEANIEDWDFYMLSYDGGRQYIEKIIERNERESKKNFDARLKEATAWNFNAAIIDLFNFYLTEKPVNRDLKELGNDEQWEQFAKDCDFQGTNFSVFIDEIEKLSSICGSVGVFVNKPKTTLTTVKQEIENGVYPYCVIYTLPNILDWKIQQSETTGRPELVYLKLLRDDSKYMIYTKDRWEIWELPEDEKDEPVLHDSGKNSLGEIPFVWVPNLKNILKPQIGTSDLKDIAWIVASIVRNISCAEEIVKWAGFPMLRAPMQSDDEKGMPDEVGSTAVWEFDPTMGEAGKADWMETKIKEPLEAILSFIDRKADEIYRLAHLSGVHGQRKSSNDVASGLALRYEFQQLTSVLSKKSESVTEAEYKIIYYWLRWTNKEHFYKEVSVRRSKNFSIDDLRLNLQNSINAMKAVMSNTFKRLVMESLVKQTLVDITDEDLQKVTDELDANFDILDQMLEKSAFIGGGGTTPVAQASETSEPQDQDGNVE